MSEEDNTTLKRLDVAEFRKGGYLHEVNRLVLHPLGLALSVVIDDQGRESLGAIWDDRDDPEGIFYGDDLLSTEKAVKVFEEMMQRRGDRIKALGYVVQPIENQRVLVTNYTDPDAQT